MKKSQAGHMVMLSDTWSSVSCLLETSFWSLSMRFSSFSIWCSCSRANVPSSSLFSFLSCVHPHQPNRYWHRRKQCSFNQKAVVD